MIDPITSFMNANPGGAVPYPVEYNNVLARLMMTGYTMGWDHQNAKTIFNFLVTNDCFDIQSATTRSRLLELIFGDRPAEISTRINQLSVARNPSNDSRLELLNLDKEVRLMVQTLKGAVKSITCHLKKLRLALHTFRVEPIDGSIAQMLEIGELKYCFPIQQEACDEAIAVASNIIRLATAKRRNLQSVRVLV